VSGLQQVHVRVSDGATGKPTPCRVRFTDAEGRYYAPLGRLTEFATAVGIDVGGNLKMPKCGEFAYIDGGCEIALPPGHIHVTICKGPEYLPLDQDIQLTAGKMALRFTLERWSHLRQHDWYPGDSRAHFLSPAAALLEGAAEDLAVVNVLAAATPVREVNHWDESVTPCIANVNLLEFSGQQPALERDGCMVIVNTHNRHPQLGSLGLLHCHRVVYPLSFGEHFNNWTLADWCDQCHRKHGLVVLTDTGRAPLARWHGESIADLMLGRIDALEMEPFQWTDQQPPSSFPWYDLLNCGFRVPLVGSSAKNSNYLPLGCVRTYARLQQDQSFSYAKWIEAIRAGRTVASNGPLLLFTCDGQDVGATFHHPADQDVRVRAEARSLTSMDHLEIIVNGKVVAHKTPSGSPSAALIETGICVPQGGWLAARCWGMQWVPGDFAGQRVYAHSSPVYVNVDGRPFPVDAAALQRLLDHCNAWLTWVDQEGRYENDAQRLRLRKVFEDAIEVLHQRAV
jgi:hypothetical protein